MRDLLVIGSGAAGLATTLAAVERGASVTLLSADALISGSSPKAQGGIAAVVAADDSPARHTADTLAVGAGLNDTHAVDVLTTGGVQVAKDLIAAGVPFDGGPLNPDLALEAGHSHRRILHAGGGATGWAITETLLAQVAQQPLVHLSPQTSADELLVEAGRVVGVRSGSKTFTAHATVLATGGYASLWGRTTNTPASRGSGLALAYQAGATLADLEFVQFHPTALVLPGRPAYLLTEALRGEGAQLVDEHEQPIVNPLLARDIVARAVARHRRDVGPVFLSLRHLDSDFVHQRFPNIAEQLHAWGLDLARDLLPVAPAAHYCMGGIRSDSAGRTDLPGLYVAGEVACTGVQGANRLASNSLLECLVFGRQAAAAALTDTPAAHATWAGKALAAPQAAQATATAPATPDQFAAWLGEQLDRDLGVERSADTLHTLLQTLSTAATPDHAAALVARLAATAALLRQESRGAHYRTDYPTTDPQWRGRILWQRDQYPRFEEIV